MKVETHRAMRRPFAARAEVAVLEAFGAVARVTNQFPNSYGILPLAARDGFEESSRRPPRN